MWGLIHVETCFSMTLDYLSENPSTYGITTLHLLFLSFCLDVLFWVTFCCCFSSICFLTLSIVHLGYPHRARTCLICSSSFTWSSCSLTILLFLSSNVRTTPRAVASLSLPGGQDRMISSIFPHFPVASLIFPQFFFIFFLILVFRRPPGKALATPLTTPIFWWRVWWELNDIYWSVWVFLVGTKRQILICMSLFPIYR